MTPVIPQELLAAALQWAVATATALATLWSLWATAR